MSADPEVSLDCLRQIKVVLVKTTHAGNIGAAARAMKTMGLTNLCLVSPVDFPSHEATRRSSGAFDVLEKAQVVTTLNEAIADCQIVFGSSARDRSFEWPLMNPRDCAELVASQLATDIEGKKATEVSRVALVFGQEASGLTNSELQSCHYHVNIPANNDYSSLNLAMAVQVFCYEMRMAVSSALQDKEKQIKCAQNTPDPVLPERELARSDEFEGFLNHLEETLIITGFHDPDNPKRLLPRLRRIFYRAQLDKTEVNLLRGILKSVQKVSK